MASTAGSGSHKVPHLSVNREFSGLRGVNTGCIPCIGWEVWEPRETLIGNWTRSGAPSYKPFIHTKRGNDIGGSLLAPYGSRTPRATARAAPRPQAVLRQVGRWQRHHEFMTSRTLHNSGAVHATPPETKRPAREFATMLCSPPMLWKGGGWAPHSVAAVLGALGLRSSRFRWSCTPR